MNASHDIFRRLLQSEGMGHVASPEAQRRAIQSSHDDLRALFRRYGRGGLVFSLVIILFCGIRRLGIPATLAHAKVTAVMLATLLTVTSVAAGGIAVQRARSGHVKDILTCEMEAVLKEGTKRVHHDEGSGGMITDVRPVISVTPLVIGDDEVSFALSRHILREIKGSFGAARVVVAGSEQRGAPFMVTGSIRRIDNKVYILIKYVETDSGRVIHSFSGSARGKDEMSQLLESFSNDAYRAAASIKRVKGGK